MGRPNVSTFKYFRVYAGPDGESHVEDVEVELKPVGASSSSSLSDLIPATGVIFRYSAADLNADWHNAPRHQWVITLSGEGEIVASDGEVRRVGPGSVMLADDTTGKGHITRGVGTEPRIGLFVPLPE